MVYHIAIYAWCTVKDNTKHRPISSSLLCMLCLCSHIVVPIKGYVHTWGGGWGNVGNKYTSHLRDICGRTARGVRSGACMLRRFFKWCNLVRFSVYLNQMFVFKKFQKLYYFYIHISKFFF